MPTDISENCITLTVAPNANVGRLFTTIMNLMKAFAGLSGVNEFDHFEVFGTVTTLETPFQNTQTVDLEWTEADLRTALEVAGKDGQRTHVPVAFHVIDADGIGRTFSAMNQTHEWELRVIFTAPINVINIPTD